MMRSITEFDFETKSPLYLAEKPVKRNIPLFESFNKSVAPPNIKRAAPEGLSENKSFLISYFIFSFIHPISLPENLSVYIVYSSNLPK